MIPDNCADIYVKLEYYNPTGSYKDRMALGIVEEAEKRGDIKPGGTIVEFTGGSTGSSLAMICAVKGYRFIAVSSDAFAQEKLQTIRLFGAELEIEPSVNGTITPDLFDRMEARVLAHQKEGAYWPRQFYNTDAKIGYANLGKEVISQLDKPVDVFCAAVGTAGMYTGVSAVLKDRYPRLMTYVLEPDSAPLLTKGEKGSHRIEGIASGRIPPLLSREMYTEAMALPESLARETARTMAVKEGIFAGTSSGLNVAAAIEIGRKLGPGNTIVTVACDSGFKYLAGDLYR
jgi:cysteine synthase A